ncbi:Fc.00g096030.m01.CDS01 [Cosmosporella sp. VM-42]
MSPKLKPLLLPQLVEARDQRRRWEVQQVSPQAECDFSYVYYTTNSSSSDITSPVTPTFSAKGHFRHSSSTSSIDLPPQLLPLQDSPVSPTQTSHPKSTAKRSLPDVQEEPMEPNGDDNDMDHFGLYSCLCDEPCQHRNSSDGMVFHGNLVSDYDLDDYDIGFLSDGDVSVDSRYSKKTKTGTSSPFTGLTSRIGARLPSMDRWKPSKPSNRWGNPMLSPATELSRESVALSGAPSSRSSSMSAPSRQVPDRNESSILPTPALSFYESTESVNRLPAPIDIELANGDRLPSMERERGLATTPLLPPLMTSPLSAPPPSESPLQSPTVAPSPVATEVHSPPPSIISFPRPSLSTKPSMSSFRFGPNSPDLPLPLPAILQEHDEWSDRLGHANFTITPQPYIPEAVNIEALRQLRTDWDAARCNYTKHLVRTGENYGETSKIYGLTEAKWAETEKRWRSTHEELMEQIVRATKSAPPSTSASRSRSRGRGRGRSHSGSAALLGRPPTDDVFAGMQWRRLEESLPSAIPRMLDADGKFPARGDEDIVGPMQRDEVMVRAHSEERKGARFWKNLAGKVGLRK